MITQKLSKEIFEQKYMINGEKSIDEVFRGVAYAIAQAETDDSVRSRVSEDFYNEMKDGKLLPAGRILANARLNCKMPFFNNCYTIDVEDSMDGITKALSQYMKILKTGGGVGFNLTALRPKGTPIKTGGVSSGPLSFAEIFDSACHTISTAGGRRGATMFILDASHPDIEEFITYKKADENAKLTQMNISVGAPDGFMEAVEKDMQWDLNWGGKVYKTVSAKELMDKIIANNKDYAEPGLMFKDNAQSMNNLHYIPSMEMKVTNPCGEIVGSPNFVCCLSALNLAKFVAMAFTAKAGFDYDQFTRSIEIAVRFLDNVLSVTDYPIQDIADQAHQYRRIGLGITGLGDAMAMMGMKYGSPESVEFTEIVFETLRNVSYFSSALLAKEKGAFPEYDSRFMSGNFVADLPQQVKDVIGQYGIRNAYLNTVAPTGTTSLSLGNNCSGGIEPIFSLEYSRTYRTGKGDETESEMVYDNAFLEFKELNPEGNPKDWFSTVPELSVADHVSVQAVAQKYVDQSISKTINLPSGTTLEEMKNIYLNAWKSGLKGCTVFHPDGKLMGILTSTPPEEKTEALDRGQAPQRPTELPCEIKEFTYRKQAYLALVGILDGSPYEIFVIESLGQHYNKRRGDFSVVKTEDSIYQLHYDGDMLIDDISERFSFDDSAATVCLMASDELRYGVPIPRIVKTLNKKGLITAFPKAVARALKKFIPDEQPSVANPCPTCGEPMRRSEGCFLCDSCGYGKCG